MNEDSSATQQQQQQKATSRSKASKLKKTKPTCVNNESVPSCVKDNGQGDMNVGGGGGPMKKRRKFRVESSSTPSIIITDSKSSVSVSESVSVLEGLNNVQVAEGSNSKVNESNRKDTPYGDSGIKENINRQTKEVDEQKKAVSEVKPTKALHEQKDVIKQSNKSLSKPVNKAKKHQTFQDIVLRLMFLSGTPYSIKGLAKATSTTSEALNYLLLSLVDKNLIIKKEFGKKVLYWANQSSNAKELDSLRISVEDMNQVEADHNELIHRHQISVSESEVLEKEPSNDDLDKIIDSLSQDVCSMNGRILIALSVEEKELQMRKIASDSKLYEYQKCPKRMKTRINAMRGEWKKRKDKCKDFVDQMSDAMEKKPKDVMKLLDLETDESIGARLPHKYDIK